MPKWFAEDGCVQRWLRNYASEATRRDYSFYLLKYFEWLRAGRVKFSPSELVRANLENVYGSRPVETERKRQHTDWLQKFISLDGPLRGLSNSYRSGVASAVMSFYRRNDSPLFGDFSVPFDSQEEPLTQQITVEEARRFISVLPLRSKVLCTCLLQCGMRITEFLQLQWKHLQRGIEKKELPLKITLRNDRGREYFTFLGEDSVDSIVKLYLPYRRNLVRGEIWPSEYVIIDDFGAGRYHTDRPLLADYIDRQIVRALVSKGMVQKTGEGKWRCDFHPHVLRHLFKTECAHAGIPSAISKFWMGHDEGIEYVYNHQHELHPEDFVEMYKKAEPYLSLTPHPSISNEEVEKMRRIETEMAELKKTLALLQETMRKK